ncbi:hypothetical protein JCM3775_000016, partial [Rhodotorula graminis]
TLVARPAKTPQRKKKAVAAPVEEEQEQEVRAWDPTQGIRFG